jgi:polyisoprenoid-binding protein YceI
VPANLIKPREPRPAGRRRGEVSPVLAAKLMAAVVFQPYPATLQLDASSRALQHVRLKGDLEVRDTTRTAEFTLDVRAAGVDQASAADSTVVQVEDFGVEVPQEAGGFVRVDPRITLEVSLALVRAA